MTQSKQIDRKLFLTWTVTSVGAAVLGCSDDSGATAGMGGSTAVGGGGTGGMGPVGGAAGTGGIIGGGAGGAAGLHAGGNGGTGGSVGGTGGTGGSVGGTGGTGGSVGGAGGSGGGAGAMNCGDTGTAQTLSSWITLNHGHVLEVSMADVMAGVAKSYDTQGISMHSHWIELTAADFATLQAAGIVHKYSCNDDHEHEFIVKAGAGVMACESDKTLMNIGTTCFPIGVPMRLTCGDADGNFCP